MIDGGLARVGSRAGTNVNDEERPAALVIISDKLPKCWNPLEIFCCACAEDVIETERWTVEVKAMEEEAADAAGAAGTAA
jgi:hypothetical protein